MESLHIERKSKPKRLNFHIFLLLKKTIFIIKQNLFKCNKFSQSRDWQLKIKLTSPVLRWESTNENQTISHKNWIIELFRVIDSKNDEYPKDTLVTGPFGWTTHLIPDSQLVKSNMFRKVPSEVGNISYSLGAVGLTG